MARTTGVSRKEGHSFREIPGAQIPRSMFDRSSTLKTAFDAGLLVPIYVDEALPGDTMNMKVHSLVRMATPLFPLMDNVFLDLFWFAVPYRLLWTNWAKFCGEQTDPGDSTDYQLPVVSVTPTEQSLWDYLGIVGATYAVTVEASALYSRAYNLIFKEWFRSEDLTDSPVVDTDDGPDTAADYVLRRRTKRHDYFTSCLPFPQKGDPVMLPLGSTAPVIGFGLADSSTITPSSLNTRETGQVDPAFTNYPFGLSSFDAPFVMKTTTGVAGTTYPAIYADLSSATAATINQIREAFQIQRLLERDARGGSRLTEILRSHFGVMPPDFRLMRPEYLGGGSTRVNVNPVARTSFTAGASGANLAGFGVAQVDGAGFVKSFDEHCVVMCIANVRSELLYQQGLERMFNRRTRFEHYWPALAHLGEQAVLNKEIYYQATAEDDDVFGYQERWAEYRYKPSRTSGVMRSTSLTPIDTWHLGIEFSTLPLLNNTFIEENAPIARVSAVPSEVDFFGDFYFALRHARPMPTFSVPGLVDHF